MSCLPACNVTQTELSPIIHNFIDLVRPSLFILAQHSSCRWTVLNLSSSSPKELIDERVHLSQEKPLHISVIEKRPDQPLERSHTWIQNLETLHWNSSRTPPFRSLRGTVRTLKTLDLRRSSCLLCSEGSDIGPFFYYLDFPQLRSLSVASFQLTSVRSIHAPALISRSHFVQVL